VSRGDLRAVAAGLAFRDQAFVSMAERHVENIPDRGIAERISQNQWARIGGSFLAEVRLGRLLPALTAAVVASVAVLEGAFPPQEGKGNEMPDVVTEA
jgi:uncharacterized membrane protein